MSKLGIDLANITKSFEMQTAARADPYASASTDQLLAMAGIGGTTVGAANTITVGEPSGAPVIITGRVEPSDADDAPVLKNVTITGQVDATDDPDDAATKAGVPADVTEKLGARHNAADQASVQKLHDGAVGQMANARQQHDDAVSAGADCTCAKSTTPDFTRDVENLAVLHGELTTKLAARDALAGEIGALETRLADLKAGCDAEQSQLAALLDKARPHPFTVAASVDADKIAVTPVATDAQRKPLAAPVENAIDQTVAQRYGVSYMTENSVERYKRLRPDV